MTWTTEKPTVPGWYWYQDPHGNRLVFCIRGAVSLQAYESEHKHAQGYSLEGFKGRWAGPLSPPED